MVSGGTAAVAASVFSPIALFGISLSSLPILVYPNRRVHNPFFYLLYLRLFRTCGVVQVPPFLSLTAPFSFCHRHPPIVGIPCFFPFAFSPPLAHGLFFAGLLPVFFPPAFPLCFRDCLPRLLSRASFFPLFVVFSTQSAPLFLVDAPFQISVDLNSYRPTIAVSAPCVPRPFFQIWIVRPLVASSQQPREVYPIPTRFFCPSSWSSESRVLPLNFFSFDSLPPLAQLRPFPSVFLPDCASF